MVVGLLRVMLHIPEAHSLKDRRSAVRRAVERVRARFNVSVAEVGDLERWQLATVAVTVVSNDRAHVNEVLDRVTSAIASAGAAQITDRQMEILSYADREPLGGGGTFEVRPSAVPGYAGGEARLADADDEGEDGDE